MAKPIKNKGKKVIIKPYYYTPTFPYIWRGLFVLPLCFLIMEEGVRKEWERDWMRVLKLPFLGKEYIKMDLEFEFNLYNFIE